MPFGRQAFVSVASTTGSPVVIAGLRVAFDVSISSTAQESSLISIYNLSNARVGQLSVRQQDAPGDDIQLEVAYADIGIRSALITGQLTRVDSATETSDRRTDLYIGGRTLLNTTISKSWPAYQPLQQIVSDIVGGARLTLATDADIPNAFIRNAAVSGTVSDALADLLSPHRRIAIQVGSVVHIYHTGASSDGTTRRVSESSGLIGVPSLTDSGVQVRVLLNGDIEPQSKIDLVSAVVPSANGVFRVTSIKHVGDTGNSPDWYSELDCVPAT